MVIEENVRLRSSLLFLQALTRQLKTHQGGNSSWYANQNAQREQEADRALRQRELNQARIQSEMQEFEAKATNKRYVREQARVERDRAMEEALIRAQCEKKLAADARSQEERLAVELERIKHEKVRDEKMRQQIRFVDEAELIFSFDVEFFSVSARRVTNYANWNRSYARRTCRRNERRKWPSKKR